MRRDYSEFQRRNSEVIAIGADSAAKFRKHWENEQIPFVALPDPGTSVLKLLGQEFKWLKFGRMPAVLVVDREGTLRYSHYGNSQSDIPQNREILDLIDRLDE